MNPPASLEEVETLERDYQIRLPEDYRAFLLEVGNGGAGPWAGLLPLQSWNAYAECETKLAAPKSKSYLASESFFDPGRIYESDWSDSCWEEWDPYQGTICLADCGQIAMAAVDFIVVSGKARGRVVSTGELFQKPVFPEFSNFLSWYENWQDFALKLRLDDWYRDYFALWQKFNPVRRVA